MNTSPFAARSLVGLKICTLLSCQFQNQTNGSGKVFSSFIVAVDITGVDSLHYCSESNISDKLRLVFRVKRVSIRWLEPARCTGANERNYNVLLVTLVLQVDISTRHSSNSPK